MPSSSISESVLAIGIIAFEMIGLGSEETASMAGLGSEDMESRFWIDCSFWNFLSDSIAGFCVSTIVSWSQHLLKRTICVAPNDLLDS